MLLKMEFSAEFYPKFYLKLQISEGKSANFEFLDIFLLRISETADKKTVNYKGRLYFV